LGDVTPHITSESGRLTVEDVLRVLSEMPERTVIYISGPEAQVETLTKQLQQASIAPDRVVSDYFCGY
jgi:ferredoxin-NADP reductase